MLGKEWWEARWKLAIAAVAVLAFVVLAPRSYQAIQEFIEAEIQRTTAELRSPERFMEPGMQPQYYDQANYKENLRGYIEEMRQPGYLARMVEREITSLNIGASFVLVPFAALLGVAMVSGEASRGTVFLLLSRPISRIRILLTKYFVGVAALLVVALFGGVGIVVSGYAHGYPAASIDAARLLASSGLFWLGTLSVLSLALLASVLFRDVIRSVIATAVTLYAIFYLPDFLRGVASWWLAPSEQEYLQDPTMQQGRQEPFEAFRIINYWLIPDVQEQNFAGYQPSVPLCIAVCLISALLPLVAALWIFRRRAY